METTHQTRLYGLSPLPAILANLNNNINVVFVYMSKSIITYKSNISDKNISKMHKGFKKIFITVGTTRFDLLCDYILTPSVLEVLKNIGCKEIIFQIGNSDTEVGEFTKDGINLTLYRFKDSIFEDIISSDLVISHAGAGSCLEVLEANKPLLVVVNEDLMDNHQLELAEQLQIDGHLYYCTCDTLINTLNDVDFSLLTPLPKANPSLFIKYLDDVFTVKQRIK